MEYYSFHNKKLPEENPVKKFYRYRIHLWDTVLHHRFFHKDIGFFTVQKIWDCAEYRPTEFREVLVVGDHVTTHWFTHITMQIKTDAGEKLIIRKLLYDLDSTFLNTYDTKD